MDTQGNVVEQWRIEADQGPGWVRIEGKIGIHYTGTETRELFVALQNDNDEPIYYDTLRIRHLRSAPHPVVQENFYYPYGNLIQDLCYEDNSANRYWYNTKEYHNQIGLHWYNYGFRWYDPQIGRWHSVDPLTSKYVGWSPFNYCIDNPMRFVDPDGRYIKDGRHLFERFRSNTQRYKTIAENRFKSSFENLYSMLASGYYDQVGIDRVTTQINNALNDNHAYSEVLSELDQLDKSSQGYDIYENYRGDQEADHAYGRIRYNSNTGRVNIFLYGNYDDQAISHELKHAYQFDARTLSLRGNDDNKQTALHDLIDEREAYLRENLFGGNNNPTLKWLKLHYPGIPEHQVDFNTPYILENQTFGQYLLEYMDFQRAHGKTPDNIIKR